MDPEAYHKEREELLQQIENLKQQLLWYKRTYEQRSLLSVIYDRVFRGKGKTQVPSRFRRPLFRKPVRIQKPEAASLLSRRILCTIVNHDHSGNAAVLRERLGRFFETVILDSGSAKPPAGAVRFPNIYYSGLLNEAYSLARKNDYDLLFFICSDVIIGEAEAERLFSHIRQLDFSEVGLYSPSSRGGGHSFCKKAGSGGLRTVPFVEGFIFLCDLDILDKICPVDVNANLYGWGLDIAKGYFAGKNNKRCIIDDDIEVEHLEGTGYSRETAELEMSTWLKGLKDDSLVSFFREQLAFANQKANG